ncbi:MAG: ComEC/Rec2 family competence protein, partial [Patescibacteria group bacterium]|nr:ComEC/Rec2 family competence protein [Patescibacteria group bacterium]
GILLGDRDAIPADILSDFKRTGLIHVVILSGYSVAIVIASILWALAFLPKTVGRLLAMLAIAAFVVMTGATAMTVRASIMAIVALAARGSGRRYDPSRGLVLAAALMVMMNPFILVYDSAFQISAISVLGLIYISPFVSEKISFVPKKFGLHEIVTATISAQAAVMPFILYLMGQISVISIIPNVLILPILPWAMLAALVSLIFGSVAPFLVWPVRLALSYMLSMTRFWSGLPFSTIQIAMSLPLLMAIYAAYVALLIFLYRKRQRNSLPLSAN